jgi:acetyltransferase-like isoleucine patch superfamily enzyme
MVTIGLIGIGGVGPEFMPQIPWSLEHFNPELLQQNQRLVYVESEPETDHYAGHEVMSLDDFKALPPEKTCFNVGIADGSARKHLSEELESHGFGLLGIYHFRSQCLAHTPPGPGILLGRAGISVNSTVGRSLLVLGASLIGQNCALGDYVTIGSQVCIEHTHVGDFAQVWNGAIVTPGTADKPRRIGQGAIIGMGAYIDEDVPDGAVMVGNPSRELRRNPVS